MKKALKYCMEALQLNRGFFIIDDLINDAKYKYFSIVEYEIIVTIIMMMKKEKFDSIINELVLKLIDDIQESITDYEELPIYRNLLYILGCNCMEEEYYHEALYYFDTTIILCERYGNMELIQKSLNRKAEVFSLLKDVENYNEIKDFVKSLKSIKSKLNYSV